MLESKIYTLLTGSTKITDYAGTRIYPVIAPQETQFPAIVYTRIGGGQIHNLSGYSTLENPKIKIDVMAQTYKSAKTLAESAQTVMEAATTFKALLVNDVDYYEPDLEIYRISLDFSCWNRE